MEWVFGGYDRLVAAGVNPFYAALIVAIAVLIVVVCMLVVRVGKLEASFSGCQGALKTCNQVLVLLAKQQGITITTNGDAIIGGRDAQKGDRFDGSPQHQDRMGR